MYSSQIKITYTAVLFTLSIFLLSSCKKEPTSNPAMPVQKPPFEALGATVYEDGGVTLKGMINRIPTGLKEYGFVVSFDSLLTKPLPGIKHNMPAAQGEFKTDLYSGIEKDKKYFFAIYSLNDSGSYAFSNIKSFLSKGTKRIKVDSIYPAKAHLGDTIFLYGKFFSNRHLNISFSGTGSAQASTSITVLNDSVGKFIVPEVTKPAPELVIQYDNRKDTLGTRLSLYAPVITEFNNSLTFRDTVTISGDHFDHRPGRTEVEFGDTKALVVHSSRKLLKVIVPDLIKSIHTTISVKAQLQETNSQEKFNIRKPELTVLPGKAGFDERVVVNGKYFHPLLSENTVLVEGRPVSLKSGSVSQLSIDFPAGPFPRKSARVSVKMLEHEVTWEQDVKISDKWVMVDNRIPFNDYLPVGAVTVNNTAYVISNPKSIFEEAKYLWKFNQNNYSWQGIEIPFDFQQGVMTTSGGKIYLHTYSDDNNFWEYDPVKNSWTARADFTFGRRMKPAFFSIGGDLYLGLGARWVSIFEETPDFTFYKYDIKTDRWTRIADYPSSFGDGIRREPAVFVLDNEAYVGCGASNSGMASFYRYNALSNSWSRIADFPDAKYGTSAFAVNGNGYVVHGVGFNGGSHPVCIKYNRSTNEWIELERIRKYPRIERSFVFVLNGMVYSGGSSGGSSSFELYETEASGL